MNQPALDGRPCPVCGNSTAIDLRDAEVDVIRCRHCRHRSAIHYSHATKEDPHQLAFSDSFLDSLKRTRLRQSHVILSLLEPFIGPNERLLDFGCGRGWFLQSVRDWGFSRIGGVDTSPTAIELLEKEHIEGTVIGPPANGTWPVDLSSLPYSPTVLTLLDVIEHFQCDSYVEALQNLFSAFGPELRTIVVKVPVSSGLLYRVARNFARFRIRAPIRQLYQTGTFPPHFHYFCRGSFNELAGRIGMKIVAETGDLDFEPDHLLSRFRSWSRLGSASRLAGGILSFLIRVSGMYDSRIFILQRT